jgi:hypothetical protein
MLALIRRQGRWPLMAAALASVAVASAITLALADAGVLFGNNIFVRTAGGGEALYTTSGRWAMWQDAFAAIVRHPGWAMARRATSPRPVATAPTAAT